MCLPRLTTVTHCCPQPGGSPHTVTFLSHANHQGGLLFFIFRGQSQPGQPHSRLTGTFQSRRQDWGKQPAATSGPLCKSRKICSFLHTWANCSPINVPEFEAHFEALYQCPVMKMPVMARAAGFINLPLMHFSINFRKCYRVTDFLGRLRCLHSNFLGTANPCILIWTVSSSDKRPQCKS